MIKVAVAGAGYWGKNLVRNFYELGVLKSVCDRQQGLSQQYLKYPGLIFTDDLQSIMDDQELAAVVIATPAQTHYSLVRQALLAGKHVFVEKPLALDVAHGEELVLLAAQKGLILMVGHILQYHPAVLKLKQLIDQGELGQIGYVYSNRLNMSTNRSEENILFSFAPHDISAILMLLNELPVSIQVSGGEYLQKKVTNVTFTFMQFNSGVDAHIFVNWLHPYKEQKLIVIGDRQMAVFDDISEEKLFLYPHTIEWKDRLPVASKVQAMPVPFQMEEPLRAECQHFLTCIQEKKQPRTNGQEGLRVLRVLQACQKSLDHQGEKIAIAGQSTRLNSISGTFSVSYIHPTVEIDKGCIIGEGTTIWHFSHVMKESIIGRDCRIGQYVVIGPKVTIGNGCKIQNNVSIYEGVTLEDDVFCGTSMVFTNVFNPRADMPGMGELRPTLIKRGATIGANATIICGHTIGQYAFIGAGAVVTHDVPDHALMVGNPARIAGWMCTCGNKIKVGGQEGHCPICKKVYIMDNGRIRGNPKLSPEAGPKGSPERNPEVSPEVSPGITIETLFSDSEIDQPANKESTSKRY
ncbi:MAG: Gfo/Idh/MocA family oxidoreductase [bacterium]